MMCMLDAPFFSFFHFFIFPVFLRKSSTWFCTTREALRRGTTISPSPHKAGLS